MARRRRYRDPRACPYCGTLPHNYHRARCRIAGKQYEVGKLVQSLDPETNWDTAKHMLNMTMMFIWDPEALGEVVKEWMQEIDAHTVDASRGTGTPQ